MHTMVHFVFQGIKKAWTIQLMLFLLFDLHVHIL